MVKRELEFAEKRRPGITQALSMSALNSTFNLEQIVVLARSLVHAVDSRDRFMRGHSEEVTRPCSADGAEYELELLRPGIPGAGGLACTTWASWRYRKPCFRRSSR